MGHIQRLNPIKLAKYKRARRQNKSVEKSLLAAGATPKTARHRNSACKLAIVGDKQIMEELRHCDITPDLMIKRFDEDRRLAIKKGDLSTACRVDELMSKSIALLTDKTQDVPADRPTNQFSLDRLSRLRVSDAVNKAGDSVSGC